MAKPKRDVVIRIVAGVPHVWCDKHQDYASRIQEIEGVEWVGQDPGHLLVFLSPRYDSDDITNEIREIILGKVPDIFLEEQAQ